MASFTFQVLLVIFSLSATIYSERLHEQIYSSVEGGAACFRRLNGTHQVGCSSADNGTVGVVQMIRDIADAQWVVQNSSAGPYMAVVNTALFYDVIELFMEQPAYIAGVLLYDVNSTKSFSQESRCPNEYSTDEESTCSSSGNGVVWNAKGTGLLRRDIPFPIFYLPKSRAEEIDKIEQCYEKFNVNKNNQEGGPLCALQLASFMYAAVNSEVCLRRSSTSTFLTTSKVCDPLGDHNVYYSLFPRTKFILPSHARQRVTAAECGDMCHRVAAAVVRDLDDKISKPVTWVTARIDSASLFDGISPGAAGSVVGVVTLLAAATTVSQLISVKDAQLYDQNILWTLFNGESFDYIGSQRVAYDISKGTWPETAPLAPGDIRLHVEVGQIGGSLANIGKDSSWPFHAFVPYNGSDIVPEAIEFINEMAVNAQKYNMTMSPKYTTNLPPSSLHSFRRILQNVTKTGGLPELLIADFKDTFTNMFYHSALDEFDKINFKYHNITVDSNGTFISTDVLLANGTMMEYEPQVKISRLATALARTLYQRVVGKAYTGNVTSSAHLVDEMLYCFLHSQACRLLMAADHVSSSGSEEKPEEKPAPLYVSVASWGGIAPIFAGHLLALLTGSHLPVNKSRCDELAEPGFSYYFLRGWNHSGVCIETTMNISAALSPAFIIDDYDLRSGQYSTWTESVWLSLWARVFVRASGAGARLAAIAGAATTLLAAALTFWLKRNAPSVFATAPVRSMVTDDAASGILRTVNC